MRSTRISWAAARRRALETAFRGGLRFYLRSGTYHAAALTYYSILSLFPAAALIYALLGLLGAESVVEDVVRALEERHVESQFVAALRDTIVSAVQQRSGEATVALVISILIALAVAGRWLRGADRALDDLLGRERSGGARRLLARARDTLVLVVLVAATLVLAFAGGGIGSGLFGTALSVLWEIGAFALAATLGVSAYGYIYAFLPSPPRLEPGALTAGAMTGMSVWILATVGFRLFADLWPGYGTKYGVFATAIVAVIWLWLTNVSVLIGGAFAAEWRRIAP